MTEPDPAALHGAAKPSAPGIAGKCAGLAAGQRAVYQAMLRTFAAVGRPPGSAELEDAARPFGLTASQVLAELATADLLGLDEAGRIRMAYPFSARPTPHMVAIANGPRVYSMCALDALGTRPCSAPTR